MPGRLPGQPVQTVADRSHLPVLSDVALLPSTANSRPPFMLSGRLVREGSKCLVGFASDEIATSRPQHGSSILQYSMHSSQIVYNSV